MAPARRTLHGHVTPTYVSSPSHLKCVTDLSVLQPTLSEAFKEAAMAAYDKPIHFL